MTDEGSIAGRGGVCIEGVGSLYSGERGFIKSHMM